MQKNQLSTQDIDILLGHPVFRSAVYYGEPPKSFFFIGPTTKAKAPPPPLELSGQLFFGFFFELQKRFFFLSGPAFTPISGLTTKKASGITSS